MALHQRIGGLTQRLRAVHRSLSAALSAGDHADGRQRLVTLLAEGPWDPDTARDD